MSATSVSLRYRMQHAVTEYDRKESRKPGYNKFALPQYLGAVNNAMQHIDAGEPVRYAILISFTGRLANAVLKSVGEPKLTEEERWLR